MVAFKDKDESIFLFPKNMQAILVVFLCKFVRSAEALYFICFHLWGVILVSVVLVHTTQGQHSNQEEEEMIRGRNTPCFIRRNLATVHIASSYSPLDSMLPHGHRGGGQCGSPPGKPAGKKLVDLLINKRRKAFREWQAVCAMTW